MKKILAIVLMTAVLVCPVFASGEAAAAPAVAAESAAPHYTLQVIQEATCTENGVSAYVDSTTGDVLFTFETAATGHNPSAAAADCDTAVVCTNCGEVLEPATGHSYTYQYDAVRNADGSFASNGTWKCDNCGDVVEATEGNAVYYYGVEEPAPAAPAASGEPSVEPAASGEPAASEEAPAEEEAAAVANPNYDPDAHNWASICIVMALVIVVVGAVLMLSFGKKKVG
ncbi:MAG: hypothetical protein ACI3W7_10200 [Oscillospiraceae bacterium]